MTAYRISGILQEDVPMLAPSVPIRRASAVLVDARAPVAPVVGDDGGLVGILSQKDCFRPALHASYHREWTGTVADYMSVNVITIDLEEEVIRAAEMFLEHTHRVFPVVSGAAVKGVLHRSDVLALLMRFG